MLENRHAEPPSAVGQSCEVAGLILAELSIAAGTWKWGMSTIFFARPQPGACRHGLWEKLMPIMQLTRPRMVQLLNILRLPTPQLELADRYRLPERVLRPILAAPAERRERMLRLSIRDSLTSDEVEDLVMRPADLKARQNDQANPAQPDPGVSPSAACAALPMP